MERENRNADSPWLACGRAGTRTQECVIQVSYTQPLWLGFQLAVSLALKYLLCLTALLWEKMQPESWEQVDCPGWPHQGLLQRVRLRLSNKTSLEQG